MNLDIVQNESSPAQEAIALLIDLAKNGEINPWDVQVIDVIDLCLEKLEKFWSTQTQNFEANLSQSGQAFLYASMLVLLKADTLSQQALLESQENSSEIELESSEIETDDLARLPPNLEKHIRRRPTVTPLQSRPVTLPELIAQLQKMAEVLAEENLRPKLKKTQPTSAESVKAIADLAHQENLTEMAGELDVFLTNYWSNINEEKSLNLEKLLELWLTNSPIHNDHHHNMEQAIINEKVAIFWALLLLTSQSKVELSQEEFYQEIKINILSNNQS